MHWTNNEETANLKISRTLSQVAKLHVAMATAAFSFSSFFSSRDKSATMCYNGPHCHLVTEAAGFDAGYLGVLLVASVDLGDALLGAFGGRGRGEGLLHPAGSLPQSTLDAKGFVQLVHLEAERASERARERERPPTPINIGPRGGKRRQRSEKLPHSLEHADTPERCKTPLSYRANFSKVG